MTKVEKNLIELLHKGVFSFCRKATSLQLLGQWEYPFAL